MVPSDFMQPGDWISLAGVVVSLLVAASAKKDAANANVEANASVLRAEEALELAGRLETRIQTYLTSKDDRERAATEAPDIAEQWRGKIKLAFGQQDRPNHHFHVEVPAPTLAHRLAIEIIRAEREALHVIEARYDEHTAIARFSGPGIGTIRHQKR